MSGSVRSLTSDPFVIFPQHVDDLAAACLFLIENYDGDSHINVGTGEDLTIGELAALVRSTVHPSAQLVFDAEKPDGTPRETGSENGHS